MKQDVGGGGVAEYLNYWTIEAALELLTVSTCKNGNSMWIDLFSGVFTFSTNTLENYYCTTWHHPDTGLKTLGLLNHKHCAPTNVISHQRHVKQWFENKIFSRSESIFSKDLPLLAVDWK